MNRRLIEEFRTMFKNPLGLVTPALTAMILDTTERKLAALRRAGKGPTWVRFNSKLIRYRLESVHAAAAELTHRDHLRMEAGEDIYPELNREGEKTIRWYFVGTCQHCGETFKEPPLAVDEDVELALD